MTLSQAVLLTPPPGLASSKVHLPGLATPRQGPRGERSLGVGGGTAFALLFDGTLDAGSSGPCDTFASPPLLAAPAGGGEGQSVAFEVACIEFWAVGEATASHARIPGRPWHTLPCGHHPVVRYAGEFLCLRIGAPGPQPLSATVWGLDGRGVSSPHPPLISGGTDPDLRLS